MRLNAFDEGVSGIARNRNGIGSSAFKALACCIHRHRWVCFVVQQVGCAIRDLGVLFHHHFDVFLIATGRCVRHNLTHEINCCRWPNSTHYPKLEWRTGRLAFLQGGESSIYLVDIQDSQATPLQITADQRQLSHARQDDCGPLILKRKARLINTLQRHPIKVPIFDAVNPIHGLHQPGLFIIVGINQLEVGSEVALKQPGVPDIIGRDDAERCTGFSDMIHVLAQRCHHIQDRYANFLLDLLTKGVTGKTRQ
ncbi:hypothetical protein D3C75_735340 [compost metagenome]